MDQHSAPIPSFRMQVGIFSAFVVLFGLLAGVVFHGLGFGGLLITMVPGIQLVRSATWCVTGYLRAWHRVTMWHTIFGLQMATSAAFVIFGEALLSLTLWNAIFFALCVVGLMLTTFEFRRASARYA